MVSRDTGSADILNIQRQKKEEKGEKAICRNTGTTSGLLCLAFAVCTTRFRQSVVWYLLMYLASLDRYIPCIATEIYCAVITSDNNLKITAKKEVDATQTELHISKIFVKLSKG